MIPSLIEIHHALPSNANLLYWFKARAWSRWPGEVRDRVAPLILDAGLVKFVARSGDPFLPPARGGGKGGGGSTRPGSRRRSQPRLQPLQERRRGIDPHCWDHRHPRPERNVARRIVHATSPRPNSICISSKLLRPASTFRPACLSARANVAASRACRGR
jgi:hypothetical protein